MKCLILLGAVLSAMLCGSAFAHDGSAGALQVQQPWARATPDGATNGAAYLVIVNTGQEADTLLSAQTPAAGSVEMHETLRDGDVLRMRQTQGGIAIAPGATVAFAPGGSHLMLVGLTQKLEDGKTIPLKLTFAKAGELTIEVKVQKTAPAGAPPAPMPMGSMQGMGGMHHQ